jgi:hypothetical protein
MAAQPRRIFASLRLARIFRAHFSFLHRLLPKFFAGGTHIRLVRDSRISSREKLSSANTLGHLQQHQPELL